MMHQTWTVELFVYLTTALSALLLLPRCANWRLRLIVGTIGLQCLAQSVTQLKLNHPFWQTRLASTAGVVELVGGALALTAIYLLRHENAARKSTEARLRLSEAAEGLPALARALGNNAVGLQPQDESRDQSLLELGGGETEAAEIDPRDLRNSRRFPVSLVGKLTRMGADEKTLYCEVADISRGGACLSLPEFIPPGALVKIEFQYQMYLGEICRTQQVGGQFISGVKFEHMIDLGELSRILRVAGFEAKEAPSRVSSGGTQK